jgi:hypothetical protein
MAVKHPGNSNPLSCLPKSGSQIQNFLLPPGSAGAEIRRVLSAGCWLEFLQMLVRLYWTGARIELFALSCSELTMVSSEQTVGARQSCTEYVKERFAGN